MGVLPGWLRDYRRDWLRPDLIAGVVIWSVVTPQAVAYAQIAGLGPEAGLMAAPEARVVVLDLVQSTELDIQSADALGELADALHADGRELRLALVRAPALGVLERGGVAAKARVELTLDAALEDVAAGHGPGRSRD